MSEILNQTISDGIAILTMTRAKARNSLSMALMQALSASVSKLGQDPQCKVIILTGEGPAFSAGHDLKEMTAARKDSDKGRGFFEETMQTCAALMQNIVNCPKPVIAVVDGIATAAGCQLVASCDLAVATAQSRFATPGVNIGLFCSTPMVAVSRNIPRKRVMECCSWAK